MPHAELTATDANAFAEKIVSEGLFVDIKSVLNQTDIEALGLQYWSL